MKIRSIIKFLSPFTYKEKKLVAYYKIGRKFRERNHIKISKWFEHLIYKNCHCIISTNAIIGKNIEIPHPVGIVIGDKVKIEDNVTIYQNVTLGRKDKDVDEYPIIKSGATIYCNSTIVGKVTVEENTIIGANSVLINNAEKNSVYVGAPAVKVKELGIKEK